MQKEYNRLKKLKVKIIKKRKEKKQKKKGENKENSIELQKPNEIQRFITIKSVTEYTHIHIHP